MGIGILGLRGVTVIRIRGLGWKPGSGIRKQIMKTCENCIHYNGQVFCALTGYYESQHSYCDDWQPATQPDPEPKPLQDQTLEGLYSK